MAPPQPRGKHYLQAANDLYDTNALALSVTVKYIAALVANNQVKRYLAKHHQDLLTELQQIIAELCRDLRRRCDRV